MFSGKLRFSLILLTMLLSRLAFSQSLTGSEFWFAFPNNHSNFGGGSTYKVFLVSQFCIDSAYLEAPGFDYKEYFSVEPGEFYEIEIPAFLNGQDIAHTFDNTVLTKGFHLVSPKPMSAFVLAAKQFSSEGETLVPVSRLGTEYVLSLRGNIRGGNRTVYGVIVGTEDNTQVTFEYWDAFGGKTTDVVTLDEGETYRIPSTLTCDTDYPVPLECYLNTGVRVTSDKPVSAFGYIDCSTIGPCNRCDVLYVNYLPVENWGSQYVTGQILERNRKVATCPETGITGTSMLGSGDYIEITGPVGTNLTIQTPAGVTTTTITSPPYGDYGYGYYFFENPENLPDVGEANAEIFADQPVQVIQYSKGTFSDNNDAADPESIVVFPTNLWESSYFFYPIRTPSAQALELFVLVEDVGVPSPISSIEVNGNNIGGFGWTPISPSSNYKYKRISFPQFEASLIQSTSGKPIGLYFYAREERETAFFGGGYGPIQDLTLCEQCGAIDIEKLGSTCLGSEVTFEPRLYTFTVPQNLNFFWDFGDGSTSTERNPSKIYDNTGEYLVKLTISDRDCELTVEKNIFVNEVVVNAEHNAPDDTLCMGEQVVVSADTMLVPGGRQIIQYSNRDTTPIPDNGVPSFWDGTFGFVTESQVGYSEIVITDNFSPGSRVDSICLNIDHPRVPDLKLFLHAPNGQVYTFVENPVTNGRGNFRKTCFSPIATDPISLNFPPFTGNFVPDHFPAGTFWAEVGSLDPQGTWGLAVGDQEVIADGSIIDWSIFVSTEMNIRDVQWHPDALFSDPAENPNGFVANEPEGPFNVSVTMQDYSGCEGDDTLTFIQVRDPEFIGERQVVTCSVSDSINLFETFDPPLPQDGWFESQTGGNSVVRNDHFHPQLSDCNTAHSIIYRRDFHCGTDSALIRVQLNCLPVLDGDTAVALCNTLDLYDLNQLIPDADPTGFWSSSTAFPEPTASNLADGLIFPETIDPGNYEVYYKVPVDGCPTDSVEVQLSIFGQPDPGTNGDTTLCEDKVLVDLFSVLNGTPDSNGTWYDLDNTGKLNPDGTFAPFGLPAPPNGSSFRFEYRFENQAPCRDTSAMVTVNVLYAPRVELVPNTPILCRDSILEITMNFTGVGPYNIEITDGVNTFPPNGSGVVSGDKFTTPLPETRTFKVTSLSDANIPVCFLADKTQLTVEVFDPIVVELAEELCAPDNSYFIPVLEIAGGDSTSYIYDLYIDGVLVKSGESVQANPHLTDTLPNGVAYEYVFRDLSNCPTANAHFFRPRKYCECVTDAGDMDRSETLFFCEYQKAITTESAFPILEPEDTLYYILHNTGGIVRGVVLDSNETPEFVFKPTYEYGKTYFISAIAGNRLGDGIDPIDTCFAINRGTPVVWHQRPTIVQFDQETTICEGEAAEIQYNIEGTPPFSLDIQKTVNGASRDTTIVLPDNTGKLTLFPEDSTAYLIRDILDGNTPGCDAADSYNFLVHVNPLPEARFQNQGDDAICDGDQAVINILLSGTGPFELYLRVDGVLDTIVTGNTTLSLMYTDVVVLKLIGVKDRNCNGNIKGEPVKRLEVRFPPVAEVVRDYFEACGSNTEIAAIPSFGQGKWTGLDGAFVGVDTLAKTIGAVPQPGLYRFVWTETNPPCPASSDTTTVLFRQQPLADAGEDAVVCGSTYKLHAKPSITPDQGQGFWSYQGAGNPQFANVFDPRTTVEVFESGTYRFRWRESVDGICVDDDLVTISFVSDLQIIPVDTFCHDNSALIDFTYRVKGGLEGQLLTNGESIGNGLYVLRNIPSGTEQKITASDQSGCELVDQLIFNYECPCVSYAGTFRLDTLRICPDGPFFAPYNNDYVLDGNDSLVFVLKDVADAVQGFPIQVTGTNRFDVNPGDVDPDVFYYILPLAGNKNPQSTLGVNLGDRCLSVSDTLVVVFNRKASVVVSDEVSFCEGDNYEVQLTGLPAGTFDVNYIDGPTSKTTTVVGPDPVLTLDAPLGTSYLQLGQITPLDNTACPEFLNSLIRITVHPEPEPEVLFDPEVCVGEEVLFEIGGGTPVKTVEWDFDNGDTGDGMITFTQYDAPGKYSVILNVTDVYGCTNQLILRDSVKVQMIPDVSFTVNDGDPAALCFPDSITLESTSDNPDYDGNNWYVSGQEIDRDVANTGFVPPARGNYVIQLIETTTYGCSGVATQSIKVGGPQARFDLPPDEVCNGTYIDLFYSAGKNVDSFEWTVEGTETATFNLNPSRYLVDNDPTDDRVLITLDATDENGCELQIIDSVKVNHTIADFVWTNSPDGKGICVGAWDEVFNNSVGANVFAWNFGIYGRQYVAEPDSIVFTKPGIIDVSLTVRNSVTGCESTIVKPFEVYPLPDLKVEDIELCLGDTGQFLPQGAVSYQWKPDTLFIDPEVADAQLKIDTNQTVWVIGTSENGCIDSTEATAVVIQVPPPDIPFVVDTLVAVGDSILMEAPMHDAYILRWDGGPRFVCDTCSIWYYRAYEEGEVTLRVTDAFECHDETTIYRIRTEERYALDVPDAFTPNGDGINEEIFPDGLGVERIVLFEVYNRYGQLMYRGEGITPSWDGIFEGEPAQADEYTYLVRAKMLDKARLWTIRGTFRLIR